MVGRRLRFPAPAAKDLRSQYGFAREHRRYRAAGDDGQRGINRVREWPTLAADSVDASSSSSSRRGSRLVDELQYQRMVLRKSPRREHLL
jgi:hypothetical protein